MVETHDIYIINIIETGAGFGTHADTGETVFIPPSVVNGAKLQIGERVPAILVPNMNEMREKTPWRAVRVPRDGVDLPPLPNKLTGHDPVSGNSLDEMCYQHLKADTISYSTTLEVAEDLNAPAKMVGNALQRLFNAGRISRAEVHHRVGQARPSFILWAIDSRDFVGEESEWAG